MENITKSKTFKVGDKICHENNFNHGMKYFFIATEYDVENYSGKNGWYYIVNEKKLCPNCNKPWNGFECHYCSFDTGFDPYWD